MDDLTGKINQLLSDPQAMEQIMSLKDLIFEQKDDKPQKPAKEEEKSMLPMFSDDTRSFKHKAGRRHNQAFARTTPVFKRRKTAKA